MITLQRSTVADIVTGENMEGRMLLVEMQYGLTRQKALESPAIFQIKKRIGEGNTLKLVAFVIKSFQDSLKVKDQMSCVDIIQAAEDALETYTHDSLKDIILAFKEARKSGKKFYNSLNQSDIFDILHDYFENKAQWLETRHKDQKMLSESNSVPFLKAMQVHSPEQITAMSNMIDPRHINKEHLRLRHTIQKQKRKRGLS
jgi:hypothetical protein